MTRMQSPTLVGHLKTLFGAGTLSGLGEGELLERFLAHRDEAAFEEILARHTPMVLGICRRWLDDPHDVEDAFQAVFLILVRNAATVRLRSSLTSWLYGVSLRVALRARSHASRRRSRERQHAEGLSMAQATEHREPDRETLQVLDEEIGRLPEKQRAAIVLCLVEGKTHDAAAAQLGCPLGTIKSRLAGGRARLVSILSRRGLVPSVALGTALVSDRLLASSIPQELARQTLEVATRLAISRSLRGAGVAASVQNLVVGVSSMMRLARIKSIAAALAFVGILAGASTALVLAQTGRTRDRAPLAPGKKVALPVSTPKLDLYGDPLPSGAITRFGTIRHRQEAPIYRIEFTRDDKFIVTDGDDSQLRVWDGHDGTLIRRISVGIEALGDFALSSDGKTVVTTGMNLVDGPGLARQVVVNDLATGRQVSRKSWAEGFGFPKVALDPDRQLLAIGNLGGQVQMIAIATGMQSARVVLDGDGVDALVFSTDRNRLAVASSSFDILKAHNRHLRVFDTKNAGDFRPLAKFDIDYRDFAFSPDGSMFACSDHKQLTFLDVESGARTDFARTFLQEMAFSADGQRLVGISAIRNMLSSWNPVAKRYINLLNTSSQLAGKLAFSWKKQTLAASGGPNVLHLWDVSSGRALLASTGAHEDRVNSAARHA